jgi:hypothetical protein
MRFIVFKDVADQFRWRLVAANGKKIADSAEGYWNRSDCLAGIELVKATDSRTPVEDTTLATVGR